MRRQLKIVLRREDHIGEPLGIAFLEIVDGQGDAMLARVGEYLGAKARILRADISRDSIEVHIESRAWHDEAQKLAVAAAELFQKGAKRNATAMFREALQLDPFNAGVLRQVGIAHLSDQRYADALGSLRRAREAGDESVEVLLAMARCASALERHSTAVGYLRRALEIDPKNFSARRTLRALDQKERVPASAAPAPALRGRPDRR
ncbi:MAG: tetratricopeptide repeat protein [Candidatus Binataceae bacterium]